MTDTLLDTPSAATPASHSRPLYVLLPSPTSAYACLAVATGYERPDEYLHELLQQPAAHGSKGGSQEVLLDLLLANSSRTRRFFRVTGGTVRAQLVSPSPEERQVCNRHLQAHADELDLALLSPALRYALRQGLLD